MQTRLRHTYISFHKQGPLQNSFAAQKKYPTKDLKEKKKYLGAGAHSASSVPFKAFLTFNSLII